MSTIPHAFREFIAGVFYEAMRTVPRTLHFIRTGRLHPECLPPPLPSAQRVLGYARAGEEMVIDGVGKLPAQPFAWKAVSTAGDLPEWPTHIGRIFAIPAEDWYSEQCGDCEHEKGRHIVAGGCADCERDEPVHARCTLRLAAPR